MPNKLKSNYITADGPEDLRFTVTKKVESKTSEKTSYLSLLYEMIPVLARVVNPSSSKGS